MEFPAMKPWGIIVGVTAAVAVAAGLSMVATTSTKPSGLIAGDQPVIPLCRTVSGKEATGAFNCEATVENGRLIWRMTP
jgi:hypothetical protein